MVIQAQWHSTRVKMGAELLPLPTLMSQAADGHTGPVAQDKGIDGD